MQLCFENFNGPRGGRILAFWNLTINNMNSRNISQFICQDILLTSQKLHFINFGIQNTCLAYNNR